MSNGITTIEEAKNFLRDNFESGTTCPCCGQMVKLYKINLGVGMAAVLIDMYKLTKKHKENHSGPRWIHPISELRTVNGDYAKLRFWGLIEAKPDNDDDSKKASGYWRVTARGMLFAQNQLTVNQKAHLFNNECLGFSGDQINIEWALKKKFDYHELMKGF